MQSTTEVLITAEWSEIVGPEKTFLVEPMEGAIMVAYGAALPDETLRGHRVYARSAGCEGEPFSGSTPADVSLYARSINPVANTLIISQ